MNAIALFTVFFIFTWSCVLPPSVIFSLTYYTTSKPYIASNLTYHTFSMGEKPLEKASTVALGGFLR